MAEKNAKPYLDAWLQRTRKQLSASGKLTETAYLLAEGKREELELWRTRIQKVMDGEMEPDIDLITRIDSLLARPSVSGNTQNDTLDMFR